MSRLFLVPIEMGGGSYIDLKSNELRNAIVQNLATDPVTDNYDGRIYYNTASDKLRVFANGAWKDVGAISSITNTADGNITVTGPDANGVVTIDLNSTIDANTTGNAGTATKLSTARNISLGGDLSGSASFDGSADVTITATIGSNSVALGTDTTGDYVAGVTASDGISATGTGEGASVALTNTDKGSSQNIFKNITDGTNTAVADSNDDTLAFSAGSGIGISVNPTTDTVSISNTGVLAVNGTTDQITVNTSSGTATVSFPNAVTFPGTVTLNADPTQALQAATKQYVDSVAEGLHVHASVATATTANIADLADPPATIDGVTLTDQMRVLVKNQSEPAENGIYVYDLATTALVRASDYNSAAEIDAGDFVFVSSGDTYNNTGWVQENNITTLGTDPIVWTQFSGAGTYLAGNGLDLIGTTFSIDTDVTADLTSIQTLTNKTLTSPSISGLYLSDNSFTVEGTANDFETVVTFTDPTADQTITFQNGTGTVAFTADITSAINALSTTDIEEGTNQYFTDERAQDAVGNILVDGTTIDFTYNDGTPSITAEVILATTSYLSTTGGLNVDISSLETKLVTDKFTKKYSSTVANGSALTSIPITHNLGTTDVIVNVYTTSGGATVECDVIRTDANTVTLGFAVAPANNAYTVTIIG